MKKSLVSGIVVILHIVGIAGTLYPPTRELTLSLTPANLIISGLLLIYSHPQEKRKLLKFIGISFSIGYLVEVLGVWTGFPFGSYYYGDVLGLKILEVPLVIGINWFILSYIFAQISSQWIGRNSLSIVLAATGMTVLDILIEPVAIKLGYWQWEGSEIPLTNFAGWWLTAALIQWSYHRLNIKNLNKVVYVLLAAQIIYFVGILLFFQGAPNKI